MNQGSSAAARQSEALSFRVGRIHTAQKLGMDARSYKCTLKALRKYLKITERDMSANEWYKINYETVPSRTMMLFRTIATTENFKPRRSFRGLFCMGRYIFA